MIRLVPYLLTHEPAPARSGADAKENHRVDLGPVPIIPSRETGATDGHSLRNAGMPVYGVSGLFLAPNKPEHTRAHGVNERIGVEDLAPLTPPASYE
jgi:acetylornithine deacetylase/succinyl-diaminopimelate desuccinylase-like protein